MEDEGIAAKEFMDWGGEGTGASSENVTVGVNAGLLKNDGVHRMVFEERSEDDKGWEEWEL